MAICQIKVLKHSELHSNLHWLLPVVEHRFGAIAVKDKGTYFGIFVEIPQVDRTIDEFVLSIQEYLSVNGQGEIITRWAACLENEELTDDIVQLYNNFKNNL